MTLVVRYPEQLLCREHTMCSMCASQRKGWVRVVHLSKRAELVRQHGEAKGGRLYRAIIRRLTRKHFAEQHPEIVFTANTRVSRSML